MAASKAVVVWNDSGAIAEQPLSTIATNRSLDIVLASSIFGLIASASNYANVATVPASSFATIASHCIELHANMAKLTTRSCQTVVSIAIDIEYATQDSANVDRSKVLLAAPGTEPSVTN